MSTVGQFRIGELARRVGATPRTVRYYEQLGLLPAAGGARPARHRLYDEQDEARAARAAPHPRAARAVAGRAARMVRGRGARGRVCASRWHHPETTDRERGDDRRRGADARRDADRAGARTAAALEELEDELVAKRRRLREVLTERRRRAGAAAGMTEHRDRYKWVALSNTTLGDADGDHQLVDRADRAARHLPRHPARPARPGNTSYLLWMMMGFMVAPPCWSSASAGSATCTAACACSTSASPSSRVFSSCCR